MLCIISCNIMLIRLALLFISIGATNRLNSSFRYVRGFKCGVIFKFFCTLLKYFGRILA